MSTGPVSKRPRPLAAAAVALIILATIVIGKEDKAREASSSIPVRADDVRRAAVANENVPTALPELDLEKLNRAKPDDRVANLFSARNWVPPPPMPAVHIAPVAPAPAPAPTAPPLPFVYVGKLVDGDKLVIFLTRQERNYSISAGDVIDDAYRVEQLSEGGVVFTYLPLGVKQTLTINPSQ